MRRCTFSRKFASKEGGALNVVALDVYKANRQVAEKGQAAEITHFVLCKRLIKKGLTVATNLHWDTLDRSEEMEVR